MLGAVAARGPWPRAARPRRHRSTCPALAAAGCRSPMTRGPGVHAQRGWMGVGFVVNIVKTIGYDRKQERTFLQPNAIVKQVFKLSVNAAGPIGSARRVAPRWCR